MGERGERERELSTLIVYIHCTYSMETRMNRALPIRYIQVVEQISYKQRTPPQMREVLLL